MSCLRLGRDEGVRRDRGAAGGADGPHPATGPRKDAISVAFLD